MLKLSKNNFMCYESSGEFRTTDEWIHPSRIINSFEIIFVLEGEIFMQEGEKHYIVSKNRFLILDAHIPHKGFKKSVSPVAFYWLHFKTNLKPPIKFGEGKEYYDVKNLLKKILHMSKTPVYEKEALDAATYLLFSELLASAAFTGNSVAYKIAEYIRINATKGITVETAAKYFGYSSDYISKLFKQTFATGIKKYISDERMKCAKDLLLNTNLSVKEIAAEMNFSDENTFIKFFVYHDDISPSKFRNKYFNVHMNNK